MRDGTNPLRPSAAFLPPGFFFFPSPPSPPPRRGIYEIRGIRHQSARCELRRFSSCSFPSSSFPSPPFCYRERCATNVVIGSASQEAIELSIRITPSFLIFLPPLEPRKQELRKGSKNDGKKQRQTGDGGHEEEESAASSLSVPPFSSLFLPLLLLPAHRREAGEAIGDRHRPGRQALPSSLMLLGQKITERIDDEAPCHLSPLSSSLAAAIPDWKVPDDLEIQDHEPLRESRWEQSPPLPSRSARRGPKIRPSRGRSRRAPTVRSCWTSCRAAPARPRRFIEHAGIPDPAGLRQAVQGCLSRTCTARLQLIISGGSRAGADRRKALAMGARRSLDRHRRDLALRLQQACHEAGYHGPRHRAGILPSLPHRGAEARSPITEAGRSARSGG